MPGSPASATMYPTGLSTRLARPRSQGLILIVCLIGLIAAAKAVLIDNLDPDCFWHLRVADQLKSDGIGPLVDRLSFASIQAPWTPYSWLAELGMKAAWDRAGYRAAVLGSALLQAAFVLAVAACCRTARAADGTRARFLPPAGAVDDFDRRPPRMCAALATALATFISVPYLSFRPVTAALLVLAVCCWLLVRDRRLGEKSRAVWLVAPLTALCVNLHLYAAFVPLWVAALLAGAVWERWFEAEVAEQREAGRRVARYVVLLAATGFACLMTPMLPGMLVVAWRYHFHDPMGASGFIAETRPFFDGSVGRISGVLVVACLLCILARRRRLRPGEQIWLAFSIILLSRMGRFAPLFALAAAPQLAVTMPRLSDVALGRPVIRLAMAAVLLIGIGRIAIGFPGSDVPADAWVNRGGPGSSGFPAGAAEFVKGHIPPRPGQAGRLITEFSWGGYLEWRLGDRYQVLLDGRTQLFTPEFWYATYLGGSETRRRFLADVQADAAILPAGGTAGRSIFRHALFQNGWTSAYRDDRAEVMLPPKQMAKKPTTEEGRWPFAGTLFPGG